MFDLDSKRNIGKKKNKKIKKNVSPFNGFSYSLSFQTFKFNDSFVAPFIVFLSFHWFQIMTHSKSIFGASDL